MGLVSGDDGSQSLKTACGIGTSMIFRRSRRRLGEGVVHSGISSTFSVRIEDPSSVCIEARQQYSTNIHCTINFRSSWGHVLSVVLDSGQDLTRQQYSTIFL